MNRISPEQHKLGFIGIGNMGRRIAQRLLEHGYDLAVYNRTREAAEALVQRGATVAESIATLSSSADVILSCLANDEAVRRIYTGPEGVLAHVRPGSAIIEMSTVLPLTSRELAKLALEARVNFLDTPIRQHPGRRTRHAGTLLRWRRGTLRGRAADFQLNRAPVFLSRAQRFWYDDEAGSQYPAGCRNASNRRSGCSRTEGRY